MHTSYAQSQAFKDTPFTAEDRASLIASFRNTASGCEVKQASAASTDMVRRILQENRFSDAILTPTPITASEMQMPINEGANLGFKEIGFKWVPIESGAPGGRSVSFVAGPRQGTYRGSMFRLSIGRDETDELYKHIDELAMWPQDLRALITDQMIRNLDNIPDYRLISTVNEITGSDTNTNGAGGFKQYREIAGQWSRSSIKDALRPLLEANLNIGVFLMNRLTANEFLAWGRDQVGGDDAQMMLHDGLTGLKKIPGFGVPVIATIKNDLVPLGRIYQFVAQGWLGRSYTYEETKVFVKREKDVISFSASRKYGMGLGNEAGVAQVHFPDV